MNAAAIQKVVESQLLKAAQEVEERLDSELDALERLDEDDLEALRERRLQQMKRQAQKKQEWKAKGHGVYSEVPDQPGFFAATKESEVVICHFYRATTWRCGIVDKHLTELAPRHLEARFIKLDAEKSPFLVERLNIWMLPTILVIKNGETCDRIEGFDSLGGVDDFPTSAMARRLAKKGAIRMTQEEEVDEEDGGSMGGRGAGRIALRRAGKQRAEDYVGAGDERERQEEDDWFD
ncbi:Thioredoxin domain-containing protein [Balamuthia mandrillaris]